MGRPSKYSPEVKERAIRMVREHGPEHPSQWAAISSIASKIGCNAETLRNWVKQAKIDRGEGSAGALSSAEREEFTKLRRRVLELEQERSILLKATVFFAKETTR